MSFLESDNASLLFVEIDGLFHPCFQYTGDLLHGVDQGGDLNV